MRFVSPLIRGRLIHRYKRFFADVVTDDGVEITAHCPNPGAMLGLNMPGLPCWVSKSENPKRKLAHTLELVEVNGAAVGINTQNPNRMVAEALEAGSIAELVGYASIRPEVKYGGEASRIDFLLENQGPPPCWLEAKPRDILKQRSYKVWLEVKNCHLSRTNGLAEFPDCVAARSAKHLRELTAMVQAGDRAVMLFVVQRMDCDHFSAAADLDPKFAAALEQAADAGVEVLVYTCHMDLERIEIAHRIPWVRYTVTR